LAQVFGQDVERNETGNQSAGLRDPTKLYGTTNTNRIISERLENRLSEEVLSQACRDGKHSKCSGVASVESGSSQCQCRCHAPQT
jgi:hypothetical protein